MFSCCVRLLFVISGLTILASSGTAGLLTLTLNPHIYTVSAGGQVTLAGLFTTADAITGPYGQDFLFGLTSSSPHLGIVAGSVLFSEDFNPPVAGAWFEDEFGGGGYLGPPTINGPQTTNVSNLRTFVVPANTPAGTYFYSYGVGYDLNPLSTVLFDESLQIRVTTTPEPATIWFSIGALALIAVTGLKRLQRWWPQ
jgi:hypothetical protein